MQFASSDKIDLNKRQAQGGQYYVPLPPSGKTRYQLHDQMKIEKKKQKGAQR